MTSPLIVKDIYPGEAGSNPSYLTAFKDDIVFQAQDDTHGYEIWRTNGSNDAFMLVDLVPGIYSGSSAQTFQVVGDTLYFSKGGTVYDIESLWRSDGTTAGTQRVLDVAENSLPASDYFYLYLYHPETGIEIWRTNGTAQGTSLVKDIAIGAQSSQDEYNRNNVYGIDPGANLSGFQFFPANDHESGVELWMTDGSEANTRRFYDLKPGSGSSYPSFVGKFNDALYFFADDGERGFELWKISSVFAPPELIKNINLTPNNGLAYNSILGGVKTSNLLYFIANDDVTSDINTGELWRTDGTSDGTFSLDIDNGSGGSSPVFDLNPFEDKLYFSAFSNGFGYELWVTDGSINGTRRLTDLNPGSEDGVGGIEIIGRKIIIQGRDSEDAGLWEANINLDGSISGLQEIPTFSLPDQITGVGDRLYYRDRGGADANGNPNTNELWSYVPDQPSDQPVDAYTISVDPDTLSIEEGNYISLNIKRNGLDAVNQLLYLSLSGPGITGADFDNSALFNSQITNQYGSFTLPLILDDGLNEGQELLEIKLFDYHNPQSQIGETQVVTIKDKGYELVNQTPVVTVKPQSFSPGETVSLIDNITRFFEVSDPDGDAITAYEFFVTGPESDGYFLKNGVPINDLTQFTINADELNQLTWQAGAAGSVDGIRIKARDNRGLWSEWQLENALWQTSKQSEVSDNGTSYNSASTAVTIKADDKPQDINTLIPVNIANLPNKISIAAASVIEGEKVRVDLSRSLSQDPATYLLEITSRLSGNNRDSRIADLASLRQIPIRFGAGQKNATYFIKTKDNKSIDKSEKVSISVFDPNNLAAPLDIANVSITDDEQPTFKPIISMEASSSGFDAISEGNKVFINLKRRGKLNQALKVQLDVSKSKAKNFSDYFINDVDVTDASSDSIQTVLFNKGQESREIMVDLIKDDLKESDEIFNIRIAKSQDYDIDEGDSSQFYIIDESDLGFRGLYHVEGSNGALILENLRKSQPERTIYGRFNYSSANISDFETDIGLSFFNDQQRFPIIFSGSSQTYSIPITIYNDVLKEDSEFIQLDLFRDETGGEPFETLKAKVDDLGLKITKSQFSVTEGDDLEFSFNVTGNDTRVQLGVVFYQGNAFVTDATLDKDFKSESVKLLDPIPKGGGTVSFKVATTDDQLVEGAETVRAYIYNVDDLLPVAAGKDKPAAFTLEGLINDKNMAPIVVVKPQTFDAEQTISLSEQFPNLVDVSDPEGDEVVAYEFFLNRSESGGFFLRNGIKISESQFSINASDINELSWYSGAAGTSNGIQIKARDVRGLWSEWQNESILWDTKKDPRIDVNQYRRVFSDFNSVPLKTDASDSNKYSAVALYSLDAIEGVWRDRQALREQGDSKFPSTYPFSETKDEFLADGITRFESGATAVPSDRYTHYNTQLFHKYNNKDHPSLVDLERDTYIYIHGYQNTIFDNRQPRLLNALRARYPGTNILGLDWSFMARSKGGDGFGAPWRTAKGIMQVGESLSQMIANAGLDPNKVHLIGQSLGSMVACAAGYSYQRDTGSFLNSVVGLDTAYDGTPYDSDYEIDWRDDSEGQGQQMRALGFYSRKVASENGIYVDADDDPKGIPTLAAVAENTYTYTVSQDTGNLEALCGDLDRARTADYAYEIRYLTDAMGINRGGVLDAFQQDIKDRHNATINLYASLLEQKAELPSQDLVNMWTRNKFSNGKTATDGVLLASSFFTPPYNQSVGNFDPEVPKPFSTPQNGRLDLINGIASPEFRGWTSPDDNKYTSTIGNDEDNILFSSDAKGFTRFSNVIDGRGGRDIITGNSPYLIDYAYGGAGADLFLLGYKNPATGQVLPPYMSVGNKQSLDGYMHIKDFNVAEGDKVYVALNIDNIQYRDARKEGMKQEGVLCGVERIVGTDSWFDKLFFVEGAPYSATKSAIFKEPRPTGNYKHKFAGHPRIFQSLVSGPHPSQYPSSYAHISGASHENSFIEEPIPFILPPPVIMRPDI